jgi:hypothetical protein
MKYRLLLPDEWRTLEHIFGQYGSAMPHPEVSRIAVGSMNGKIDAFLCLQPVWHVEPAWTAREVRGQVDFSELTKMLVDTLPKSSEYYAFAPDSNMERIITKVGLEKMPYTVWRGIV